ncbi:glycosyltransferase family 2 protein, partial [Neisseria meningitidis]|uniref:glycosyltransferase family 2 protein n=1 Tax=Neisseria meningitidis TaxID=487 RepID=UPI00387AC684
MPSEAFRRHRAYRENKLQPLVSVLICAYNVEKYFAQSLAAVVNQTWRNLDILIVDDGSTDGTLAIAQRFQEQDGRIRILAQPRNSGLIPSLNIGLDELAKSGGGGGENFAVQREKVWSPPVGVRKIWGGVKKDGVPRWGGEWGECCSKKRDATGWAGNNNKEKLGKKPPHQT